MNLEEFVRRGRAAQEAVDTMTDNTSKVDLVALVQECRMGLSVLLNKESMDYDPSDQARELIGRVDRIMDELKPYEPPGTTRDWTETVIGKGRMEELRTRPGAVCSCVVVVSGPDEDDEIGVLGDGLLLLKPDTAKALAVEILKRLQIKPMELEY